MFEIPAAFVSLVLVGIMVALLWRFRPAIDRDARMEAWTAARPVVFACRARSREGAARTAAALVGALGPTSSFVNLAGSFPFPYYRLLSEVEVHGEVVVVRVRAGRRLRMRERPAPAGRGLSDALSAVTVRADVEALWLHGELGPDRVPYAARKRLAWLGEVANDGAIELTEMIGRASWIGNVGSSTRG